MPLGPPVSAIYRLASKTFPDPVEDVDTMRTNLDLEAKTPLLQDQEKGQYSVTDMASSPAAEAFPMPSWVRARQGGSRKHFPQAIAHRGYKAAHPENTLEAFRGAVKVGANAIETDIHLSKDDVVVLSHDGDLKRCFGRKEKIIDCDWDELSQLRTLKPPHEPMPRLRDLLEHVAQPDFQHIWVLLDIKLDNNADKVMKLIAETIASVKPGERAWKDRLVLGIWAAKFLPLCLKYAPGFPISHIGFSTCYARQFLKVPNVSFNMLQKVLLGPIGTRFIRDVKEADRPLFVWTVNEKNMMKWSIQRDVDGVITDNPKLFNEVCDEWSSEERMAHANWAQSLYTFWLYMLIGTFWFAFNYKFPETVDQFLGKGRKSMKAKATLKISQ